MPTLADLRRRPAWYTERLSAPWWGFLAMPVALVGVLTELGIGYAPLASPPAYAAGIVVGLLLPLLGSRVAVAVRAPADADSQPGDDGEGRADRGGGWLVVDDARLPGWAVAGVAEVDLAERRRLLGLDAHPLAFVVQRPWIAGGVRVELADPADPTPYWYVSSRRPAELAAALRRIRDESNHPAAQ